MRKKVKRGDEEEFNEDFLYSFSLLKNTRLNYFLDCKLECVTPVIFPFFDIYTMMIKLVLGAGALNQTYVLMYGTFKVRLVCDLTRLSSMQVQIT